jgi:hypothetical protein
VLRTHPLLFKSLALALLVAVLVFFLPVRVVVPQSSYTGAGFPYQAFSDLPATRFEFEKRAIDVAFVPGHTRLPEREILAWIESSLESVVAYYGRLPTPTGRLLIVPVAGRRINGTTFGYGGAASRILYGRENTARSLERDWVLVHELVHHGFPFMDGRDWAHEGVATYVEPIARAQMGLIPVDEVWRQLVVGLPQGQPRNGDKGLDGTPTWGRTYWGGAMYFLIADVEIRRRTGNRRGLQHVLRRTVEEGGNITVGWTVERFNAVAARATGTSVLAELYACMKDAPRVVKLPALWRDLGVMRAGRRISYDENAPLASIRRAITEPLDAAVDRFPNVVQHQDVYPSTACANIPWIDEQES